MIFEWKMTEEDWKRLRRDDEEHICESNDFFGSVNVGKLCIEFIHSMDESAWYPYTNVYEYGKDTGYGYTQNGVPYDLLDSSVTIPVKCETFEEFKKEIEKYTKLMVDEDHLEEQAEAPLADWQ